MSPFASIPTALLHFPTPRNASRTLPESHHEHNALRPRDLSRARQERPRDRLARSMDASPSSPSSPSSLKNKLRTTVCCCFGGGAGGERVRCRRRAVVGDFRYDSLSYALNFDEGEDDDDAVGAAFRYKNFNSRLPPSPAPAQRPTAIA